ncbi:MAG: polysaccharide biosynthesis C-terminal domain-containing protein [Lachnospiraceae bacterium]|nr:polysaccharide biosynthesis C-terminal domain-containing protein [Lachnospiraceae bacterium]
MSASKKKRGLRKKIEHLGGAESAQLYFFLAVCLFFFGRCIIVSRIGIKGSAYLFSSGDLMMFLLMLFPIGAAAAVERLLRIRASLGAWRNAGRIFASASLHAAAYLLISGVLWGVLSEEISARFLIGRVGQMALITMLPMYLLSGMSVILFAACNAYAERRRAAVIAGVSGLFSFLLILFFSGLRNNTGAKVSELLMNAEVRYIYGASGVIRLMVVAAGAALLFLLFLYGRGFQERKKKSRDDKNKRHESPSGMLYLNSFPVAFSLLLFCGVHFASLFCGRLLFAKDASAVYSYQWGNYSGVLLSFALLPLLLIFLIMQHSFREIEQGLEEGGVAELRLKAVSLLRHALIVLLFFAALYLAAASPLCRGLLKCDSAMSVRMLRLGVPVLILAGLALCSMMLLLALHRVREVIVHSLIALVPSLLMLFLFSAQDALGIYAILPAQGIFFLLRFLLDLVFLIRALHPDFDPAELIRPFLCALAAGAAALVPALLFPLFLPQVLTAFICIAAAFFVYFFLVCRLQVLNAYRLRELPLGNLLMRLGRILHCLE